MAACWLLLASCGGSPPHTAPTARTPSSGMSTGVPAHATSTALSGTPACSSPGRPGTAPVADPAAPHGLFVLAGAQPLSQSKPGPAIQQYLVHNPDVCGATVFVNWSRMDRGPSVAQRYDWSVIDNLIAPWAQAGKLVNLLLDGTGYQGNVLAGVPGWLQGQLQTVTCGADTAPVYWQQAYVTNWQTFVSAVVQHYATDTSVGYIHVGVGTGAQTLVVGVRNSRCLDRWNAAGYQTQWPTYVSQMIAFAGGLHSPKQLIVSFNDYADFPPASQIAQEDAAAGVGFGFDGLQASDARAYGANQPCGQADWCALYNRYAGKMPLFVQTLGQSYPGAEVGTSLAPTLLQAEATGPLPPLLRMSLALHTQIFELYSQDWLLAFDPNSAGYAQYHTQYAQALASAAAVVGTAGGAPPAKN